MANNSKVKTFISDYSLSWTEPVSGKSLERVRHIIIDPSRIYSSEIGLCGAKYLTVSIYTTTELDFKLYSRVYKSLCPKCLSKMPEKIVEELKFNYIVKKLKS